MIKLLVFTLSIFTVSSCESDTRTVTKEVIVDRHMRSVIANGDKIISLGADEVVVTASELSDVYQESCK